MIFPVGPDDAADLARVHVASWRETYPGMLPEEYLAGMSEETHARGFRRALLFASKKNITLAAADRNGFVGYVDAAPSRRGPPSEAEIATLYVLKAAQGQGVGIRLLCDAARALAANGAKSLLISVLKDNAPARAFYEHLGGVADPPRPQPGPGGRMVEEVSYRWADIGRLIV